MTTRRAQSIRLPSPTTRRGISLTEILIAIMILAIGLVSLATLFPIGLMRIHEAQRYTRTAFLAQSTGADLVSRGLLNKTLLRNPNLISNPNYPYWYGPAYYPFGYDPWIQDTPYPGSDWLGYGNIANAGAYRGVGGMGPLFTNQTNDPTGNVVYNPGPLPAAPGPGLPVAYDPLWWNQMGAVPIPPATPLLEYRFGSGVSLNLSDGSGGDGASLPSVWGLQRVTDLVPTTTVGGVLVSNTYNTNVIRSTFISPEDVVWQEADGNGYLDFQNPALAAASLPTVASPSPVLPDLVTDFLTSNYGTKNLTNDWRYTCMFVGRQSDSFNGKVFDGDVVVFENRPFGFDALLNQVSGERVVQAVFGYGTNLVQVGLMNDGNTTRVGVPLGSDNAILLLWSSAAPDPEIKTGSWVADVTYERRQLIGQTRFQYVPVAGGVASPPAPPSGQRCYWYQVQRVTPAAYTAGTPYAGFGWDRFAFVYTSTKLRAKTLWNMSTSAPYHVNAALVSPHVVGVAPRTFAVP